MARINILFFGFFLYCLPVFAEVSPEIPALTPHDRVLVLAPHPDDEVLGAAGVIQKALRLKIPLKIVYLSHGDNNEVSFIVYEKRLVLLKKAFLAMGELRRNEATASMKFLGLSEDQLVFLGYPDFGTMEIFTKYWNTDKPFRSMLTRVTKVPYSKTLSPGAPYVGESVVRDLEKVLLDFKPTRIFVTNPVDVNRDHRSLGLFLQIALWDLEGQIRPPAVFHYLIHAVGWPRPKGYHPQTSLLPPKNLADSQIDWQVLSLSDDEIKIKKEALSFYKSQLKCDTSYLFSFIRKNELFGDYPVIKLKAAKEGGVFWEDVTVLQEEEEMAGRSVLISKLAYAREDGSLLVRIGLKHRIDKNLGISVYLFGYSKKQDFALMPKINLAIGFGGIHLRDKKKALSSKGVSMAYEGRSLIIKVPLSLLGDPQNILVSVKTKAKDLPFDDTAWRVLKIE